MQEVNSLEVLSPRPKLPKLLVPPTMVRSPLAPEPSVWDNAAILVDKPTTWTSFDVCGKLRGVLGRRRKV